MLERKALRLDEFPCRYINTPEGTACHMELSHIKEDDLPTVSILTPTYNRNIFTDLILRNWNNINYPKDKLEWIIVDDSDKGKELNELLFKDNNIRYIRINNKLTLGKKRNFLASLARNDILVHMDDDDFYPSESVIARVKTILLSKNKSCVGCTKTLCYDMINDQTFEAYDPSDDNNKLPCTISESTLAYTKEFWNKQRYNNEDTYAECLEFIKNRYDEIITIPYIFVITQLSHSNNTIKRYVNFNTKHTVQFTDNLSMIDNLLIQNLRAKIISQFPEWSEAISIVKKCYNKNKKYFIKILDKKPYLKTNSLIIEHYRQYITKKECTSKDIVYYCGPGKYLKFNNIWTSNTKGLGGSEEAVVNISEGLAKRGYNITIYNNIDKDIIINGVKYKPYWKWIPGDKQHTTIIWRDPSILDISINSNNIILDLHDVIDNKWLTIDRLNNVNYIICKSEYHKDIISNNKCIVIPNGINTKNFKQCKVNRIKNRIVCTSSPDRCITSLLKALPIIRKHIPDVEIYWAYGFKSGINKGGMENHDMIEIRDWVNNIKNIIKDTPGFYDLGRLDHSSIVKLMKSSNIFAYGTSFPEIDCISMTKALSSGCIPIVSPIAALKEKLYFSNKYIISQCRRPPGNIKLDNFKIDYNIEGLEFESWVDSIIKQLQTDVSEDDRLVMSNEVNNIYDWKYIIDKWITYF